MSPLATYVFCAALALWVGVQAVPAADEVGGVTVLEAEQFTSNLSPRSSHEWDLGTTIAGFSGTGYMEALPNNGANLGTAGPANPELQFTVNFTSTGTHYIWFRAHADANTDDSVYVGLDGGSATALTLNQQGSWQWSNTLTAGGAATFNVASTGNHTVNAWMREDGVRIDRILLTTNSTFVPTIGNVWHIPTSNEGGILTGGATMRNPLSVANGSAVTIYSGNQFQGAGTASNQLQTGSTVFYKKSTDSVWSSVPMAFFLQNGNNKYYSATIPATGFAGGDVIQYYLKIPYSDHLPTFVYGTDSQSTTTEFETAAQQNPFSFIVRFPLTPANGANYHSFNSVSGTYQARIFDDSGHIALAEPDLSGAPFANVITFAPPSAKIGGVIYDVGKVLSFTPITNGLTMTQAIAGTTVTSQLTFTSEGVLRYEVTNWNGLSPTETDISAPSDATEHFYGFGEKFNSLDQAGNKVHIMLSDIGGDKNDFSYKSSSWFMSNRGYGFHLDSTAESFFDMRNGAADRYTIQNLLGSLKFNIVAGPKLTDVLSRYTGIVGRPFLPPPWVFGTWVSSDIWRTGGEVRYAITKHLERGIPISVFVFDSPWERSYNDFKWNIGTGGSPDASTQFGSSGTYENQVYPGFSNITEMMTFLQQHGVKVVCWMTPFINTGSNNEGVPGQNQGRSPNYDFASNNGYFVRTSTTNSAALSVQWWKGIGSPVDFTNPAAKNWFTSTQLQPLLTESNVVTLTGQEPAIGGFKTDDGENINNGAPYIPLTASYFDGRTGTEMQNGYCIEYHKTVSSVLGMNGILFARSGFNGTGAFPAGWPGDNQPSYTQANGLQSVITAGDSAAMSGFSIWGSDIGGYQTGNAAPNQLDLFMRWAQYGAFTPIMQMHRQISTNQQYPWNYDSSPSTTGLDNYRTYARLHSQLFPYIYSYAKEASTTGLPIIRPVVLLNQTDPLLLSVQHTYYFGNELLVAPMNAATSTSRNIQLPAGNWYDYWTNAKYAGGQNLVWSNGDFSKIPLLVREGSVIPMLNSVPQTLCDANYVNNPAISTMDSSLQFLVYPGAAPASFTMYDNTSVQCSVAGPVMTLTLASNARPVKFKVFQTSAPAGVERNGVRLPHLASQSAFDAASLGWFYDPAANFVLVKFQHLSGGATISFGPDTTGDGVTDSWRQYYGISDDAADNDGDGVTNGQEYVAGTNPNDPQSVFKVESINGDASNGFTVNWPSQLGIIYQVQWKNSLGDATWQSVTPDFTGTGSSLNWLDDGTQTSGLSLQRFYRVGIP